MSTNLSDKVNLPINWTKVLVGSGLVALFMFVLGIALKAKFLLVIADLFIFGTMLVAVIVFVLSLIRKYAVKDESK